MSPFFSIVIPTRQRHETLPFAIKTVLQQSFSDYEIVVADNCSSRETYEVVQEFDNPKIKYFRSEEPLAMTDNWEFAISKAAGEYVIVFGDDDGLVNNSLLYLYQVIQKTGFEVIRWERVYYSWSNIQPSQFANCLNINFANNNYLYKGKEVIQSMVDLNLDYTKLPMLYNSAIRRDMLLKLKQKTGRLLKSITPDIYSGYAIAYLSGSYLSLGNSLSINGGSAKSNGTAYSFQPQKNPIVNDFKKLNAQSDLFFHPQLPNVTSMTSVIIEPFFQLRDAMNIHDIKVNKEKIFSAIMKDIKIFSYEEQDEVITTLKKYLQEDQILHNILNSRQWKEFSPLIFNPLAVSGYKKGLNGNVITLDASDFDLLNVFDVSRFAANFYDFNYDDFSYVSADVKPISSLINRIMKKLYLVARTLLKGH